MRYLLLIILNIPIVLLALLNIVTKYKMNKMSKGRFISLLFFWAALSVIIVASFPIYNLFTGRPALQSDQLTSFDIIQTTAIVLLLYAVVSMRQKLDGLETRIKDLHQELSIKLSKHD